MLLREISEELDAPMDQLRWLARRLDLTKPRYSKDDFDTIALAYNTSGLRDYQGIPTESEGEEK